MSDAPIPLVDLVHQHNLIADEIAPELQRVMSSGGYTDGPDVAAFEREFAAFCGTGFAVGVANGTDALEIALRAAGIGPGDEVIVPANTFAATAEAVVRMAARPIFVDCDEAHMLIDAEAVAAAVTPATRAILPVHLYGQMAPMAAVRAIAARHDLVVIADAAQAQGATAAGPDGTREGIAAGVTAAATSFYPGKNLGAYGDAGGIATASEEFATICRSIGHHGADPNDRYLHARLGFTSRLDTIQAVVLRAKLARLAEWNDQRREAAARYDDLLNGAEGIVLPATAPGNEHVWHLYTVRVAERDAVLADLRAAGVGAGIHYPVPLHRQPVFAADAPAQGAFPVAESAGERLLTLPLFPGITEEQQIRVAKALSGAVSAHPAG